ncbi:MAG: sulfatase-like hydrolase/transferase [Phycisphaera sp.]|nr:sulfatase-like hydrolase/transferase [Phycisphaera sp.]
MQVYERRAKAGESIDVPQGNWTGGVALIAAAPKPTPPSAARADDGKLRRNVLFIAVDDMRVELGCYGDTIAKSPNIDALAKRGTLFTHAYAQQAVCNPSRASIMTGLRPETLRIWDLATHFRERRPDVVTLPQAFMQQGYFTRDIGKIFHNWRQKIEGDPASWSVPAEMHYNSHGNDQPIVDGDVPPDLSGVPRTEMRDVPDEAYFDGRIAAKAVDALREIKAKGQPFFLAVGFWKPHAPFNAPKKYWDLYDRSQVTPPINPDAPIDVPPIALHDSREILRGFKGKPPTDDEVLALRHGYYAAISYVDAQIGKVVGELDRLGLADNTIIVFWSDHGYHLGEQTLWAKTSNFELDARVPMIIVTPDRAGGRRTDAIVELLDVYPTLADLCDVTPPDDLEGVSLRPVLDDPAATIKPAAFTWHCRPAYPSANEPIKAIGYSMRTARHRYTEWRDVHDGHVIARELYDHSDDPRETVNIAGHAEQSATVERLAKELAEHIRRAPAPLDGAAAQ